MNRVGQMTIEQRAALEYCKIKGIDPMGGTGNWSCNEHEIQKKMEEFSLMLYCLKQAESTK